MSIFHLQLIFWCCVLGNSKYKSLSSLIVWRDLVLANFFITKCFVNLSVTVDLLVLLVSGYSNYKPLSLLSVWCDISYTRSLDMVVLPVSLYSIRVFNIT